MTALRIVGPWQIEQDGNSFVLSHDGAPIVFQCGDLESLRVLLAFPLTTQEDSLCHHALGAKASATPQEVNDGL